MKVTVTDRAVSYELSYIGFLGSRQYQPYIKTLEEATRRKERYYNTKECKAIIKRVVETFENDDCISIEKTIIEV